MGSLPYVIFEGAVQWVRDDVKRLREKGGRLWSLKGKDLAIPLYSTLDGSDLRASASDLVDILIDLQCTEHVNWLKATEKISRKHEVGLGLCSVHFLGSVTLVVITGHHARD